MKGSEIVGAMRQALREAEAGLYGESEEVTAYKRHLARGDGGKPRVSGAGPIVQA